jgi:hypothetical protein
MAANSLPSFPEYPKRHNKRESKVIETALEAVCVVGVIAPAILPQFIGQLYIDSVLSKVYVAKALVAHVDSWIALN